MAPRSVATVLYAGWPYAVIFGLPLFLLCVTRNVLIQAGGLDAFIYTSYIQDYGDLIKRYGLTYYSARIAHIFPARFVVTLFGSEQGYLVYRYLLLCGALGAAWGFAKRTLPACGALFFVVFVAFHPWLLRSLFWDHYDSTAVVYLLGITALLGGSVLSDHAKVFLAGGLYALAVNCNLFLLAAGGVPLASFFLVSFDRRHCGKWARSVLIALAGFSTSYLILCLVRYAEFPSQQFFFDRLAISFGTSLVGGAGETWHADVIGLVASGWLHLLLPAVVWSAGMGFLVSRKGVAKSVTKYATLNLTLVMAVYIWLDFGAKVAVISLPYYFIYLFPATIIAAAAIAGELAEVAKPVGRTVVFWIATSVCAANYMLFPKWRTLLSLRILVWLAGVTLLAWGSIAISRRYRTIALACFVLALAASANLFYSFTNGTYAAIHLSNPALEWDVYRAAVTLQRFISRYPPERGAAGFWYAGRQNSMLNSVQSMYLWGYSRLADPTDVNDGMPVVNHRLLNRIQVSRYLVLLAETERELEEGQRALGAAGVKTRTIGRDGYTGKVFSARYLMLEQLREAESPFAAIRGPMAIK